MINKPYDEKTLRPVDLVLLGRLEALETMAVKMATVVGENLGGTKQALMGLGTAAGAAVQVAEEDAAALWLHTLFPITWKRALPVKQDWTLQEIKAESEEAIRFINEELAKFLPLSGMATALGNILYPITLSADAYLDAWRKPRELEDSDELLRMLISQVAGGAKAGLNTPYLTDLLHPAGKGNKEAVFFLPNGRHFVAIMPQRASWVILTFPQGLSDVVIHHHQARLLDLVKLKGQLREIFINSQPPKIRSMQRPTDDQDAKIQVLLTEIFESKVAMETHHRGEHFHVRAVHGESPSLKQVVSFVMTNAEGMPINFELVAIPSAPKKFFTVMGDRLVPTDQDALSPITKAILVEALTTLERAIVQAKKKQAGPVKAASKKKATVKKTAVKKK